MRSIVFLWVSVFTTLFTLPAHGGSCTPPPEGIVAWWSFDEKTGGDVAHDRGGFDHHGTYSTLTGQVKPQPVAATVGNGLSFQAKARGFVEVPHDGDFDLVDFSIDFWIQAKLQVGVTVLLDKRLPNFPYTGYHLYLNNGKLGLQLADTKNYTNYGSSALVADGKPHFVAVTVDRKTTTVIHWYLDGKEVLPRANPTGRPLSLANRQPLRIGARTGSPSGFFDGVLDELEIFGRVLAPSEILALSQAGVAGKCKCSRTDNLPFSEIGSELDRLIACAGPVECRNWSEVEYLPPQDLITKYPVLWWLNLPPQPPTFDIALQDQILASADSHAAQSAPKCRNGKTKTTVAYQLRPSAYGGSYGIFWRIKYGCC